MPTAVRTVSTSDEHGARVRAQRKTAAGRRVGWLRPDGCQRRPL